jgi:uncharacterized protein DUF4254
MDQVDKLIREILTSPSFKEHLQGDIDLRMSPVTLTYLIERLIITHVKLYMMEDQVRNTNLTDAQVGEIKRRIDYWNGVQRPRLVEGIGEIFARAVKDGNEELVREPNLKDYKAR